jgi:chromosome segregation ATPase
MELIREDEDALARLEARLDLLAQTLSTLRTRNAELEQQLNAAEASRDAAVAEVDDVREQLVRASEDAEALRNRQREAASRIKNLLSQVEQMDLLAEV